MEAFDDGFATTGVGDDAIPTYDLETLAEMEVTPDKAFQKTKVSADAATQRSNTTMVRVGAQKRVSPLDELRSVFKTAGGLKLSRDFTERSRPPVSLVPKTMLPVAGACSAWP